MVDFSKGQNSDSSFLNLFNILVYFLLDDSKLNIFVLRKKQNIWLIAF